MDPQPQAPDRNLAMELVRGTEAAALAAGRWMGRGDKNAADGAAVDAMRLVLNTVEMDGIVVIGEGEKDEAPMLFNGEEVGDGSQPQVDIAVDPLEGTTLTALGRPNAISVIGVAERGTMFDPGPCFYMDKIAVGPEAAQAIDINAPIKANLEAVAKALGEDVDDITAVILDRPRHEQIIKECREAGARIRLIPDGDVAGIIHCAESAKTGIDMYMGSGGAPEGVLAAAALKCMGGQMWGRLLFRNEDEKKRAKTAGIADLDRVYTRDEMVTEHVIFSATGVTDGSIVHGARRDGEWMETETILMRSKSGSLRRLFYRQHNQ
jgi:fructose-1,6-bisphosphatase class II